MDAEGKKGGPSSVSILSCRELNLRLSLVISHAIGSTLPENEATAQGGVSRGTERQTKPGWQTLDPAVALYQLFKPVNYFL